MTLVLDKEVVIFIWNSEKKPVLQVKAKKNNHNITKILIRNKIKTAIIERFAFML